jgi:hypothetical protein
MSTKTDFTPEEWESIRNAPYLAAAAWQPEDPVEPLFQSRVVHERRLLFSPK